MANYPTFSYYSRYFSDAFEGDVKMLDAFTPITGRNMQAYLINKYTKYLNADPSFDVVEYLNLLRIYRLLVRVQKRYDAELALMRTNLENGVTWKYSDYPNLKQLDSYIGRLSIPEYTQQLNTHLQRGDQLLLQPPDSVQRLRAFSDQDFMPYVNQIMLRSIFIKEEEDEDENMYCDDDDNDSDGKQIPHPEPIQQEVNAPPVNEIPNRDQVLAWVLENCAQALRWPTNLVDFQYRQRFLQEVVGCQEPYQQAPIDHCSPPLQPVAQNVNCPIQKDEPWSHFLQMDNENEYQQQQPVAAYDGAVQYLRNWSAYLNIQHLSDDFDDEELLQEFYQPFDRLHFDNTRVADLPEEAVEGQLFLRVVTPVDWFYSPKEITMQNLKLIVHDNKRPGIVTYRYASKILYSEGLGEINKDAIEQWIRDHTPFNYWEKVNSKQSQVTNVKIHDHLIGVNLQQHHVEQHRRYKKAAAAERGRVFFEQLHDDAKNYL